MKRNSDNNRIPVADKMKIFRSVKTYFARMGLKPQQLTQSHPFNAQNSIMILVFGSCIVFNSAYFFMMRIASLNALNPFISSVLQLFVRQFLQFVFGWCPTYSNWWIISSMLLTRVSKMNQSVEFIITSWIVHESECISFRNTASRIESNL